MGFYNFMSLSGKSLREKMHVAFALMSIIPLLIMAYLVTGYIFPSESGGANFIQISLIVVLAICRVVPLLPLLYNLLYSD